MSSIEFSRLRKVNKIMMITLWCIFAFQTVFSLFLVDDPNVFKVVIPGLLCLALTVTILHVRKVFVGGIKYIMVVGAGLINFLFVYLFKDPNGFITAYLVIALLGFYQEFKLVIPLYVLCCLSIAYGYFTGGGTGMFGDFADISGFINILFSMGLFTFIIACLCISGARIRKDLVAENEQNRSMIDVLKSSVQSLTHTGEALDLDMQATYGISRGVKSTFDEINAFAAAQFHSLQAMKSDVNAQAEGIFGVAEKTNTVKAFSSKTFGVTAKAAADMQELTADMQLACQTTQAAVDSIESFREYSRNIETILLTVDTISQNINLLAINAAIEAARAGQYGKGFAVVADEVGKLAKQTGSSTQEIAQLLSKIHEKTEDVSGQIYSIQQTVETGSSHTAQVAELFDELRTDSQNAAEKAELADALAAEARNYSERFVQAVTELTGLSERTAAAVKSALQNISEQNMKIQSMVGNSSELKAVIAELETTI